MIIEKNRRQVLYFLSVVGVLGIAAYSRKSFGQFTEEYCVNTDIGMQCGADLNLRHMLQDISKGVGIIATQTKKLISVQKKYLNVIGLKEEAAKVERLIINIESGNVNNVGISEIHEISDSSNKAVIAQLERSKKLEMQQEQELKSGVNIHNEAIIEAWNGGKILEKAFIGRPKYQDIQSERSRSSKKKKFIDEPLDSNGGTDTVFLDAPLGKSDRKEEETISPDGIKLSGESEIFFAEVLFPNSFNGFFEETVENYNKILNDIPPALEFMEKSKETYEKYAEAFYYEAKIPLPASQRNLKLEPFSIT